MNREKPSDIRSPGWQSMSLLKLYVVITDFFFYSLLFTYFFFIICFFSSTYKVSIIPMLQFDQTIA